MDQGTEIIMSKHECKKKGLRGQYGLSSPQPFKLHRLMESDRPDDGEYVTGLMYTTVLNDEWVKEQIKKENVNINVQGLGML